MMITVPDDILGLAFGKNRQNLKLVEELTGYKIELLKAGDLRLQLIEGRQKPKMSHCYVLV